MLVSSPIRCSGRQRGFGSAPFCRRCRAKTRGLENPRNAAPYMVVHAAGRVPEIADLNLDVAEVEWNKHGVTVNEFLQSVSNPAVYAAGDAAARGGPPLTPVASYDGAIVAANLLNGNHQKPSYLGIPTVVFTIPLLAVVGLGEREARKQNLKFVVKRGLLLAAFLRAWSQKSILVSRLWLRRTQIVFWELTCVAWVRGTNQSIRLGNAVRAARYGP
jgi:pyruvate/2-oxoglutarate dehydrogenase complex dihydrolipoamide dehydrogenase (E3) component